MSQDRIQAEELCHSTVVVKRESKFGGRGFLKGIQILKLAIKDRCVTLFLDVDDGEL